MKIGNYLINKKVISELDLEKALALQKSSHKGKLLGEILIEGGTLQISVLLKHLVHYLDENNTKQELMKQWISQDEIDDLIQSSLKK